MPGKKSKCTTEDNKLTQADPDSSLEIFRQLALTSRDIIYSTDSEGVLNYVSDQAVLYGFTREQILTKFTRSMTTGEEFPLRFRCTRTASSTELWISDIGPGIPNDVLPHIFEPFFSTKTKGSHANEGMVVDLSLSRSFVETMGGTISVKTRTGWGTTFTLSFPPQRIKHSLDKQIE